MPRIFEDFHKNALPYTHVTAFTMFELGTITKSFCSNYILGEDTLKPSIMIKYMRLLGLASNLSLLLFRSLVRKAFKDIVNGSRVLSSQHIAVAFYAVNGNAINFSFSA